MPRFRRIPSNPNTTWGKVYTFFQTFHASDPYYELIFLTLIVFFTFFYVSIVFNVEEVADNLRKHGGFMPGIRPGRATAEYLNTILTRLTVVGAIYLALVSFLPQFMLSGFKVARLPLIGTWLDAFVSSTPGLTWIPVGMNYQFYFGGTSLLILVGVAMDTVAQIEAQLVMRNYEGFLGGGSRLRGREPDANADAEDHCAHGCAWCRKRYAGALASRAAAFAANFNRRHFRALKEQNTPLAEEVRAIMQAGTLVPDDVTIRVVRERTSRDDCKDGYILDGFPRTPAQALMLNELAVEQGKTIQAIDIEIPRNLLEKRMTGRRSCPVCGEIYNIYFKPPKVDNVCDRHPEAQLIHRADDNSETVTARLATYEEQTRPLLDHYRSRDLLRTVDGTSDRKRFTGTSKR